MADTQTTGRETEQANPRGSSEGAGPTEKALARGRSPGTPFVLLGGVALVVWAVVAVVALALLLVWWLA